MRFGLFIPPSGVECIPNLHYMSRQCLCRLWLPNRPSHGQLRDAESCAAAGVSPVDIRALAVPEKGHVHLCLKLFIFLISPKERKENFLFSPNDVKGN